MIFNGFYTIPYLNISMKLGIIYRIDDQLQGNFTNLTATSHLIPDLTIASFINSPVLHHSFPSISTSIILLRVSYLTTCSDELIRTLGSKCQKPQLKMI